MLLIHLILGRIFFKLLVMRRLFILIVLFSVVAGTGFAQIRIMLMGDSITEGHGSGNGAGFKDELQDSLNQAGLTFKFVGPEGSFPFQGHYYSGSLIDDFYYGAGGYGAHDAGPSMDYYKPEYVLIHLGTNGNENGKKIGPYTYNGGQVLRGDNMSGRLANLLAYLAKWKTGERGTCLKQILVCQLIDKPAYNAEILAFNEQVAHIYEDSNAGHIPAIMPGILRLVDQYSTFDSAIMLTDDSIHPNDDGYMNMATQYFQTFRTLPTKIYHDSPAYVSGIMRSSNPEVLSVKIVDDSAAPVFGAEVWFEVVSGEAVIVDPVKLKSDENGIAGVAITASQAGLSVIRAHSNCLRDSVIDFTVNAERSVSVDGVVRYCHDGSPVSNVSIEWEEESLYVDTTNSEGVFKYQRFPPQTNITLLPEKARSAAAEAGILMYDASLTARNAVGLSTLTAEGQLAADVNRDGKITLLDAALIGRYSVGLNADEQSLAGSWIFSPESAYFPQLDNDVPNHEFIGILMGDVHGGWSQGAAAKQAKFSGVSIKTQIDNNYVKVTIMLDKSDFLSLNLTCKFDVERLHLKNIEAGAVAGANLLVNKTAPGIYRVGMFSSQTADLAQTAVLTCTFEPIGVDPFKTVCFTNFYINADSAPDLSPEFNISKKSLSATGWHLAQNYPNPFNGETVLVYRVEQKSRVDVSVYNNLGQLVRCLASGEHARGEYTVRWNSKDEQGNELGSGIYFCVVTSDTGKKMVCKMELLR